MFIHNSHVVSKSIILRGFADFWICNATLANVDLFYFRNAEFIILLCPLYQGLLGRSAQSLLSGMGLCAGVSCHSDILWQRSVDAEGLQPM